MKPKYYVIDTEKLIATIYEHEKFGKVIVFRDETLPTDQKLRIYSRETQKEDEDVDLLKLVLDAMPT